MLWAVRPSPLPTTTTPGTTTTTPSSALTSAASAPASSSPQTATGLPNQPNNQPNQLNNQQQQQQYLTPLHVLGGHSQPVAFLSWSPDDRRIITCRWGLCVGWGVGVTFMISYGGGLGMVGCGGGVGVGGCRHQPKVNQAKLAEPKQVSSFQTQSNQDPEPRRVGVCSGGQPSLY